MPPRDRGRDPVVRLRRSTGRLVEQAPAAGPQASPAPRAAGSAGAADVYGRFSTAASALVFAEQTLGNQPVRDTLCLRGDVGPAWWVHREMPLETAREAASLGSGQIYLRSGGELRLDRGWGSPAGIGRPVPLAALEPVVMTEVVRTAGLHPAPSPPLKAAVLLLPGRLVTGIVRRALDLRLTTTYRPVTLGPLLDDGADWRAGYAVRLSCGRELPRSLLAALDRNPAILVCREVGESVLLQFGRAAALSDWSLATLPDGDGRWVLADPAYGCARLDASNEPSDGITLFEPSERHRLADVTPEAAWTDPSQAPGVPEPAELTLVAAPARGAAVDAALLSDAELGCLQDLLAGEPIAETAILVPGRDRHLLTAPGGLLQELPVGEPLNCVGPGSLYVPLGYRTDPLLPATARGALFPTGPKTAVVLLPDEVLAFDLEKRCPVWRVWAGPAPHVDRQLPRSAAAELTAIDQELDLPHARRPGGRLSWFLRPLSGSVGPDDWERQAYEAELARDWLTAAQLLAQHGQPEQAARLYERAAEEA